ncbi:MAG: helix-turn-helix transcriptional regulator [Leucobacter sp.]
MDPMNDQRGAEPLDEVGLLSEPVRRRLYEFVIAQAEASTRDEVAGATGISRSLAAYHLDKLAKMGLLDISYARTGGRSGPGAGRPAKRYARSKREISVTLPPRRYDLFARIIATAADSVQAPEFRDALSDAADREGELLGTEAGDVMTALVAAGYEPVTRETDEVVLRNCPFHSVVHDHAELACGLNHAFVAGILQGAEEDRDRAELCPGAERCCVVIHPSAPVADSEPAAGDTAGDQR